jgi:hypothetical protein
VVFGVPSAQTETVRQPARTLAFRDGHRSGEGS